VPVLDKLANALGASRWDLLRAAGILEPVPGRVGNAAEHRMLALYRDLSEDGRSMVERFVRFVHADEQRWVQAPLVEGEELPLGPPRGQGPSLFDGLVLDGRQNSPVAGILPGVHRA
jgi:hypothetical protein